MASIVFDESEMELLYNWLDYVEAYLKGENELHPPKIKKGSLIKLEISFKRVELYHSFCRSMGYIPDMEWIDNIKAYLAEEIDFMLKK